MGARVGRSNGGSGGITVTAMEREARVSDPLGVLRAVIDGSHKARPEDMPALALRCAALLGAREMVIYLIDYEQRVCEPLAGDGGPPRDAIAVDGTLAG